MSLIPNIMDWYIYIQKDVDKEFQIVDWHSPLHMLHVLNALSKTTHIAVSVLAIKEYANVDLWSFLIDQCLDCSIQWNLTFFPVSSLPYWAHLSDWWNWFKNSWITQNDSEWILLVPWSSIVNMDDACQKRVYIVRTCMY